MWWRLLCVGALFIGGFQASVCAQDAVSEFYKGRQITVIVGSTAGGGYDIYARLLARHMPTHIPGHPAMVVSNMAGAGSNAAAAYVYNVAPKDGTVIAARAGERKRHIRLRLAPEIYRSVIDLVGDRLGELGLLGEVGLACDHVHCEPRDAQLLLAG